MITMDEYHFTVDGQQPGAAINLKAGQLYDMTLKNSGKLAHEIWWGKNTQTQEGHLDGYSTELFADVEVTLTITQADAAEPMEIVTTGLTEIALQPGQQATVEFTLPDTAKGKWEIGCFQLMPKTAATSVATAAATQAAEPDVPHYMVGMKADLIVQ